MQSDTENYWMFVFYAQALENTKTIKCQTESTGLIFQMHVLQSLLFCFLWPSKYLCFFIWHQALNGNFWGNVHTLSAFIEPSKHKTYFRLLNDCGYFMNCIAATCAITRLLLWPSDNSNLSVLFLSIDIEIPLFPIVEQSSRSIQSENGYAHNINMYIVFKQWLWLIGLYLFL